MVVHQILRCCECRAFQVQLSKKAKRWSCKVCGAKQSYLKVYASSSKSGELRPLVQEYNMRRVDEIEKAAEEEELQAEIAEAVREKLKKGQEDVENTTTGQETRWGDWAADDEDEGSDEDDANIVTVLPDDIYKREGERQKRKGEARRTPVWKRAKK